MIIERKWDLFTYFRIKVAAFGQLDLGISSVRIRRGVKRISLVLAVPEVLGLGCSPTSACAAPYLGFRDMGLSSACPSSLALLEFHTLQESRCWSPLLPPSLSVSTRWHLLHGKCYVLCEPLILCPQMAHRVSGCFTYFYFFFSQFSACVAQRLYFYVKQSFSDIVL